MGVEVSAEDLFALWEKSSPRERPEDLKVLAFMNTDLEVLASMNEEPLQTPLETPLRFPVAFAEECAFVPGLKTLSPAARRALLACCWAVWAKLDRLRQLRVLRTAAFGGQPTAAGAEAALISSAIVLGSRPAPMSAMLFAIVLCMFRPHSRWVGVFDWERSIFDWCTDWSEAGCPRMDLPPSLVAALALSTAADVRAPWRTWMLLLPAGQIPAEGQTVDRVLCVGSDLLAVLLSDGTLRHTRALPSHVLEVLRAIVTGVCAYASIASAARYSTRGSPKDPQGRRTGPPDYSATTVLLVANPVHPETRRLLYNALAEYCATGRKLAVQYVVRGHWRWQAYGRARADRRLTWIQPYWKGPEAARALLHTHTLKEK